MTLADALDYLKTVTVNDPKAKGSINVVEAELRRKEEMITDFLVEGRELKMLREAVDVFLRALDELGEDER